MLCILVFIILVFITSTIVDSPNENDTCIVKEGDQFPSFINHGYGGTETVLCSMDTCLCNGSNTRYKGCQSCCCSRRERTEGNESITYEENYTLQLNIDILEIICFEDFQNNISCIAKACILKEQSDYFGRLERFYISLLGNHCGNNVGKIY